MGLIFNKIIPLDMLAQLPRPFVHRLRDIRIKQLEEQNKEQEKMMKQQEQARINQQNNARQSFPQPQQFSGVGASLEDFIDELT
jgi:hypothetical protein